MVLEAVYRMMVAARTAPKGKGIDIVEVAMATDDDIERLSVEMVRIAEETRPVSYTHLTLPTIRLV